VPRADGSCEEGAGESTNARARYKDLWQARWPNYTYTFTGKSNLGGRGGKNGYSIWAMCDLWFRTVQSISTTYSLSRIV
jgi:hypothetical protein